MQYNGNISFAIRTIKIYRHVRDLDLGYEHTLALGALLNVFSVIIPNDVFEIDLTAIQQIGLPQLHAPTEKSIIRYLKNLRNGLAHKTEVNFTDIANPDTLQIFQISISSRANATPIRLNSNELDSIIETIDRIIMNQFPDKYAREYS